MSVVIIDDGLGDLRSAGKALLPAAAEVGNNTSIGASSQASPPRPWGPAPGQPVLGLFPEGPR